MSDIPGAGEEGAGAEVRTRLVSDIPGARVETEEVLGARLEEELLSQLVSEIPEASSVMLVIEMVELA